MNERERPDEERSATREVAEEPEPDWAQRIRDLRKARGERLATQLGEDGTAGDRPDDHG